MISCSAGFKKGGYYFSDNLKSYYGNDKKKIYFRFSEKYSYSKQNFNVNEIKDSDRELLKDFDVIPSRKMLFSYHSQSREMMAFLLRSIPGQNKYETANPKTGKEFFYHIKETDKVLLIDNIFPFQGEFIRVIEKTAKMNFTSNKKNEILQETFIFPEITRNKPF